LRRPYRQAKKFCPAYLALKKRADGWFAEPKGPQVVFREREAGGAIKYPELRAASGGKLRFEDVEVVAGSSGLPFNRKRLARGSDARYSAKQRASRCGRPE